MTTADEVVLALRDLAALEAISKSNLPFIRPNELARATARAAEALEDFVSEQIVEGIASFAQGLRSGFREALDEERSDDA